MLKEGGMDRLLEMMGKVHGIVFYLSLSLSLSLSIYIFLLVPVLVAVFTRSSRVL